MAIEISARRPPSRDMARVFKALGDEKRIAIFELLRSRCQPGGCTTSEAAMERTVGELAKEFDLALSTVSHHLKELRNAGLIECERQGQRIHCTVSETMLRRLREFLGAKKG